MKYTDIVTQTHTHSHAGGPKTEAMVDGIKPFRSPSAVLVPLFIDCFIAGVGHADKQRRTL